MKKLSWMLVTAVTGLWINPTNAEWTGHVSAEMRAFGK